MKEYTQGEWMAEGERLYGKDPLKWRFVCPACGRISTGEEFHNVGATINDMMFNCIGRFKVRENGKAEIGCDWTANGLFGTQGKGVKILMDSGKEVQAFAFG